MKRREGDGRNSGQQVLDGEVRNDDLVLRNDARDAVFRDRFHGVKERERKGLGRTPAPVGGANLWGRDQEISDFASYHYFVTVTTM